MPEEPSSPARAPRPHRLPPPPLPLPDLNFLAQIGSVLGLTLWKAFRDVKTWSEVEPDKRRRYFRPPTDIVRERFAYAKHEAPELEGPLATFSLLVQAPEAIDAEQIAAACEAVYKWAEERGMMLTALYFAEAAAYVQPDDPAPANQAARTARRNLMRDRAAMWHYRAYKLAVKLTDKRKRTRETIWALIGYGAMMRDAGNYKEARRFTQRAATRAVGARRPKEAGMAFHDLFVIAVELQRFTLALKHARSAFNYYPVRHPSIPRLAHDLAFMLIRLRHFPSVLAILTKAIPLMLQPVERAIAWSSLAWAAGGAGLRDRFREAERVALELLPSHPDFAPAMFIHLAEGARALREWDRARGYARAAQESAVQTQSPTLEEEAAALLACIERREPAPAQAESTSEVESLTALVLSRLDRWKAPGEQPGADGASS
jgi:hypothetical protein